MLRALERGLTLQDFNYMTVGMIIDFVITYNNEHLDEDEKAGNEVRPASQSDFDRF